MKVKFIEYDGIKGYSRIMYNDVKDSDKYYIEVTYDGKDIKALLEYLFEQEQKIDKAIEHIMKYYKKVWENANDMERLSIKVDRKVPLYDELLEILGDKENENN